MPAKVSDVKIFIKYYDEKGKQHYKTVGYQTTIDNTKELEALEKAVADFSIHWRPPQ